MRINDLYQYLGKGIMPWNWDWENYAGNDENKEMIGFFYPEDIEAVKQIHIWEIEKRNEDIKKIENKQDTGNNNNTNLPPAHANWNSGKSFNPNMFLGK